MEVDYEGMIPLTSCEAALAEGAPAIHEKGNILSHEHLVRGNADEVLANSAFVVTEHYSVPINEHAFMEPEVRLHSLKVRAFYSLVRVKVSMMNNGKWLGC